MGSNRLAIIAPQIGAHSETFIRRHMTDLLPGRTVVIAGSASGPYGGHWSVDVPTLLLDRLAPPSTPTRLLRALRRGLGRKRIDSAVDAARWFLKQQRVEVALGEYLDLSLPWLPIAAEAGLRFFAYALGYDISLRLREPGWKESYLRFNDASGVFTVSAAARARLIGLGLRPDKVHVVPLGVDVPTSPVVRVERQSELRCLAVGRMVPKKAPILTLDAFRRAAEVCPELRLDFVGGGELLASARHFVHTFGLERAVTLHGEAAFDLVRELLARADLFLQHSMVDPLTGDEEGMPVAILEAMAAGLPVISTRHAGIPEAVEDEVTGRLVDEGDTRGMADAIVSLARDGEARARLGAAGWRRAGERFSWERLRPELLRIMGLS